MAKSRLVALIAFSDWLVGVTRTRSGGYCCWVINPERVVLTDGEVYTRRKEALAAGCSLVQASIGQPVDFSRSRLIE